MSKKSHETAPLTLSLTAPFKKGHAQVKKNAAALTKVRADQPSAVIEVLLYFANCRPRDWQFTYGYSTLLDSEIGL